MYSSFISNSGSRIKLSVWPYCGRWWDKWLSRAAAIALPFYPQFTALVFPLLSPLWLGMQLAFVPTCPYPGVRSVDLQEVGSIPPSIPTINLPSISLHYELQYLLSLTLKTDQFSTVSEDALFFSCSCSCLAVPPPSVETAVPHLLLLLLLFLLLLILLLLFLLLLSASAATASTLLLLLLLPFLLLLLFLLFLFLLLHLHLLLFLGCGFYFSSCCCCSYFPSYCLCSSPPTTNTPPPPDTSASHSLLLLPPLLHLILGMT